MLPDDDDEWRRRVPLISAAYNQGQGSEQLKPPRGAPRGDQLPSLTNHTPVFPHITTASWSKGSGAGRNRRSAARLPGAVQVRAQIPYRRRKQGPYLTKTLLFWWPCGWKGAAGVWHSNQLLMVKKKICFLHASLHHEWV